MRFLISLLIAIALLIPTQAHADMRIFLPHTFKVAVVCGDGADCTQALRAVKDSSAYLRKRVNVTLQIAKVLNTQEGMTGSYFERMAKWRIRAEMLKVSEGVDVTLFYSAAYPPSVSFFDFNQENILGLASDIGVLGSEPCFAFVKVMGSEQFTTRITIHELGHLLGAHHGEAGIMAPSASVNQYSDEYSLDSLREILEHLSSL